MFDRLGRIESETPFVLEWFVQHGIQMLGYLNMDEKTIHEKQLEQLYSVHLIVHEIGHAVDYENRYRMFGTVNTKSFYNLGNERERQEYFLENAFSLWGEY